MSTTEVSGAHSKDSDVVLTCVKISHAKIYKRNLSKCYKTSWTTTMTIIIIIKEQR